MDTTTVLSMRSLTTLPGRVFLRLRAAVVASVMAVAPGLPAGALLLLQHREQARHLPAALADLERVVQLLHRVPETEVEQLLAQFPDTGADLVRTHLADCHGLHAVGHAHLPPSSWRSTKRVLIGSFDAPRSNAMRARSRVMPSSSNGTRPGLTT